MENTFPLKTIVSFANHSMAAVPGNETFRNERPSQTKAFQAWPQVLGVSQLSLRWSPSTNATASLTSVSWLDSPGQVGAVPQLILIGFFSRVLADGDDNLRVPAVLLRPERLLF